MKTIIPIILLLFATAKSNAQHDHLVRNWHVEIQSMERPLEDSDTATVVFKIRFTDTVFWNYHLSLNKQVYYYDYQAMADSNLAFTDWWMGGSALNLDTGWYYPTDSIVDSLQFYYDSEYLPFSYRTLKIEVINDSDVSVGKTKLMIYFTPYNTLEVWDYNDFLDLKREWNSPEE